jgi:protein-S-isoprenylcysteine O-methyltransferase Ste14
MKARDIMPTTYFLFLVILTTGFHFLFPMGKWIPSPLNYLGILLILFGIVLNLWTDGLFKKFNTTVKPHLKPTSLQVSGPFRISRHPMYLGGAAILLGTAIILGSSVSFLFPAIFIILMEIIFIPMEEKNLEDAFGQEYLEYRKRVRRWI